MSNRYPHTVEYRRKKPNVPKPPEILKRSDTGTYEGVSGKDVALWFSGVLVGIIFGLLIGRFV